MMSSTIHPTFVNILINKSDKPQDILQNIISILKQNKSHICLDYSTNILLRIVSNSSYHHQNIIHNWQYCRLHKPMSSVTVSTVKHINCTHKGNSLSTRDILQRCKLHTNCCPSSHILNCTEDTIQCTILQQHKGCNSKFSKVDKFHSTQSDKSLLDTVRKDTR